MYIMYCELTFEKGLVIEKLKGKISEFLNSLQGAGKPFSYRNLREVSGRP